MRALFFGTPAIAVPALRALADIASVVGVVCQPDRPAGRGLELRPPPIKLAATELAIPVVQPQKIRTPEFAAWLHEQRVDVALVMAYGRILPPAVLGAPRRGCMNLHASLLPRYRGAAPIQWSIVRGEQVTGISLMQMDEGCDTGPVYSRHETPISDDLTADELADRLADLAARVVRSDLERALRGELEAVAQDDAEATMAPLLDKQDGRVGWNQAAKSVHDHVRGMTSWPGAFTSADGKILKLLRTRVATIGGVLGEPGRVVRADKHGVVVACGSGSIALLRAQLEGRKPLDAPALVAGRAVREGMMLGAAAPDAG